jgi:hypothetical protein
MHAQKSTQNCVRFAHRSFFKRAENHGPATADLNVLNQTLQKKPSGLIVADNI